MSARGTRFRGRAQLYAKGVVAFSVLLGSWLILVVGQPGLWLGLLSFGGLILGTSLIAFTVMHDANHGAYFRTRRLNHLMGWTADALLGLSSYAWRVKHNVAHHTYTNVDGYDADITQVPFARLVPGQAPRPWYRLQHYYIWALYCLMALRWQTVGDVAAFRRGSIGTSALRMPRRWDLAGLVGGKVIFVSWAIVIPMLVYPWYVVLGAYVGFSMITSLVMATTFQLAHCVEEADFPERVPGTDRLPGGWEAHQVQTTVDFARNNRLLTWYLGGLNLQIEHHLFPRICHVHYPNIATIVEKASADFGIRYTAHEGLFRAVSSHWRWLRRMGRAPEPRAPNARIDEGHVIHDDYRFDAERPGGHRECT